MASINPDPWLRFALTALAAWRVTHLLAAEDGPGELVARLRRHLGDGLLGQLMDCFYCLSLWVAAPLAALGAADVWRWALNWLALSGAACLLERLGGRPLTLPHLPEQDD